MKFKVRGLVFVGFAAAILSANAMAADNTVTSKDYVDTKFQTKVGGGANADKLVQATDTAGTVSYVEIGNAGTDIDEGVTKVVTGNAVNAALEEYVAAQAQANQSDWAVTDIDSPAYIKNKPIVDTTFNTASDNAATSAAIADYVTSQLNGDGTPGSGYQNESTADYQLGGANGEWKSLGQGFATSTSQVELTMGQGDNINKLMIDVATTADGTLANADSGETDFSKLPTAGAVKTYVDSKATSVASDILTDTQNATDDDHALTNAATTTALNGKQNLQAGDTYQVSRNGSWTAANGAVSAGTHIAKTNNADGSVTVAVDDITSAATDINDTDTGLTTGAAVYDFVTEKIGDATGGNTIPEMPNTCSKDAPCVLTNSTSDGSLVWVPIQQAE